MLLKVIFVSGSGCGCLIYKGVEVFEGFLRGGFVRSGSTRLIKN